MKNKSGFSVFIARAFWALSFAILAISITSQPGLANELANPDATPADESAFDKSSDVSLLNEGSMTDDRGSGGTQNNVTVSSNQTLSSSSSNNTVNVNGNLTNGSINAGNNFGGSGFGSYVLNTGNNSTINSGVSLSVLMMPQTVTP